MTKHYPQEFRDDVVKVARLHQTSMRQVALDFGISAAILFMTFVCILLSLFIEKPIQTFGRSIYGKMTGN
jgi:hypothetical protein